MSTGFQKLLQNSAGAALTIILKSGTELRGSIGRLEDGLVEMTLGSGPRAWIDVQEVAAIQLHAPPPPPAPVTRASVSHIWQNNPPSDAEIGSANILLASIVEALQALNAEDQITRIRLCSGEPGRFRIDGSSLEVGFLYDEPTLPAREIVSLLSAIL